jgi:hypothetical protein
MVNPCLPATMAGRCLGRHHNHPIPGPVRIDRTCHCWCHAELVHQIRVILAHLAQLPYKGRYESFCHSSCAFTASLLSQIAIRTLCTANRLDCCPSHVQVHCHCDCDRPRRHWQWRSSNHDLKACQCFRWDRMPDTRFLTHF